MAGVTLARTCTKWKRSSDARATQMHISAKSAQKHIHRFEQLFFQLDSRCCPFPSTTEMLKRTPNLLPHNSYPSCDLPVAVWSLQKKKKRTSFNSAVNKKSFRTNTTILAADLAVGKMWTEENEENEHKRWGEMGLCAPFSILWPHELHRTNRKVCTRKEYQTNRFRLKPKGNPPYEYLCFACLAFSDFLIALLSSLFAKMFVPFCLYG